MTFEEVEEQRVNREGVEVACWVFGEGGHPVTLITGLGTPAEQWGPLPGILAGQGYQVVVIENRDCGKSSNCEGVEYSMVDMADDVAKVLETLGIVKTYLLGISMGGMIAQEVMLNYPDLIDRAILMATNTGPTHSVQASPLFLAENLVPPPPGGDEKAWLRDRLANLMGPGWADKNPESMERITNVRVELGSDSQAFLRQLSAIMQFDSWDRLASVDIPVLVMHGEADPLVPFENGRRIASRIPNAELLSFPEVGHFVPLESPVEVIQAIFDFFPVKQQAESSA